MSLNTIAKAEVLKGRLNIAGHTHCDRLGQTSWVAPYRNAFEVVVATEPVMLIQPLSVPPFWMVSHCPGAIHCAPSGFVSGNNGAISLRHGHGNSKSQNAYGHRRMAGRVLDYAVHQQISQRPPAVALTQPIDGLTASAAKRH
jgi:hypothetical protein